MSDTGAHGRDTVLHAKVVQYLQEIRALEGALTDDLVLQLAIAPRGPLRDALERHLSETRAQSVRINDRLNELSQGAGVLIGLHGVVQYAGGQVIALARGPMTVLRGVSLEEKVLKNAKDALAGEAAEIAAYLALEEVATAAGDAKTVTLAREHRTQEEAMERRLRELLPKLAESVVRAEAEGSSTVSLATSGAADAARTARAAVEIAVRRLARRADNVADDVRAGASSAAEEFEAAADATADSAAAEARGAVDDLRDVPDAARRDTRFRTGQPAARS